MGCYFIMTVLPETSLKELLSQSSKTQKAYQAIYHTPTQMKKRGKILPPLLHLDSHFNPSQNHDTDNVPSTTGLYSYDYLNYFISEKQASAKHQVFHHTFFHISLVIASLKTAL